MIGHDPKSGLRISREIDIGTLIMIMGLIAGGIWYQSAQESKIGMMQAELAVYQLAVTRQIEDLKRTVQDSRNEITLQITGIPLQGAKLSELERRFADDDRKMVAFDARLSGVERSVIINRADIDNLKMAGGVRPLH